MCKGGPLAISISIPTKRPITRQSSQAMAFAYLSFQSLASRILPNKQRTSCPSVDLLLWSGVLLKPQTGRISLPAPPSRLRFLYKLARNFQWSDIVAGYLQTFRQRIHSLNIHRIFWSDLVSVVSRRIHETYMNMVDLPWWMDEIHGKCSWVPWQTEIHSWTCMLSM